MDIERQIKTFIHSQPEPKRTQLQQLHALALRILPNGQLWFLDGKDENGKVVTNPSIGYGCRTTTYADGKSKDFYQVGLSANKTGISVYILGLEDKTFLAKTFGKNLGKAKVTGYCIRFNTLGDIDVGVLADAMQRGIDLQR